MSTTEGSASGTAAPFGTKVEPRRTAQSRAADAARIADAARVVRYARYSRLRRLAQDEGLRVDQVMTGRAIPRGLRSILDRAGRIVPEPIDFLDPEL